MHLRFLVQDLRKPNPMFQVLNGEKLQEKRLESIERKRFCCTDVLFVCFFRCKGNKIDLCFVNKDECFTWRGPPC